MDIHVIRLLGRGLLSKVFYYTHFITFWAIVHVFVSGGKIPSAIMDITWVCHVDYEEIE